MTDYIKDDFLFSRVSPHQADELTATCRHCGEKHTVGNPHGEAVWMRVQHDHNCRLAKAANEAAESKR